MLSSLLTNHCPLLTTKQTQLLCTYLCGLLDVVECCSCCLSCSLQTSAVTDAASSSQMNTLCYLRSLPYVESKSCSLLLLLFGTAFSLCSCTDQFHIRERACASHQLFSLPQTKQSCCVNCLSQDLAAQTLCFPLTMFGIFLNLWICRDIFSILRCDFQNKSIFQLGSDSPRRRVNPSPLLTWTCTAQLRKLRTIMALKTLQCTLGSCNVCAKQKEFSYFHIDCSLASLPMSSGLWLIFIFHGQEPHIYLGDIGSS